VLKHIISNVTIFDVIIQIALINGVMFKLLILKIFSKSSLKLWKNWQISERLYYSFRNE